MTLLRFLVVVVLWRLACVDPAIVEAEPEAPAPACAVHLASSRVCADGGVVGLITVDGFVECATCDEDAAGVVVVAGGLDLECVEIVDECPQGFAWRPRG